MFNPFLPISSSVILAVPFQALARSLGGPVLPRINGADVFLSTGNLLP